jgi:RHS repeat-associated protein
MRNQRVEQFFAIILTCSLFVQHATATLPDTGEKFRDWRDCGCHMSPGAAGAPASGAANAGNNQAVCEICKKAHGMSEWWVNEPWVNLWITDEPLSYFTSSGDEMVFRFTYKQRYKAPGVDEVPNLYSSPQNRRQPTKNPYFAYMRTYGMTNASWSHNWMMNILFWDRSWELITPQQKQWSTTIFSNSFEALVFRPEGSILYFNNTAPSTTASPSDALTQVQLQARSGLGYPTNALGPSSDTNGVYWGDDGAGFVIVYPDGSQDVFGLSMYLFSGNAQYDTVDNSTSEALLTQRVDPYGRVTSLGYEFVNFVDYHQITTPTNYGAYRLRYVVDPDGRTNTFVYNNSTNASNAPYHAWQLAEADDPFGRKATFSYGSTYPISSFTNGVLASITDAVSNTSYFAYRGTNGWLTNLTTPYGTTAFSFYQVPDTNVTDGFIQRAVCVSEPEGAHQLYYYLHQTNLLATSVSSPTSIPGQSFDDGTTTNSYSGMSTLDYRNSFHWDRRQYSALSASVLSYLPNNLTNALPNLTADDYRKAGAKHWLLSYFDPSAITESISSEREPSPDAQGQIEGPRTWFNYPGKISPEMDAFAQLGCVARLLPDGSAQYITYNYNLGGLAPSPAFVWDNESSYSLPNGTAATLTNSFRYPYNSINLTTVSNSLGQFFKLAYNGNHQVTYITNSLNQVAAVTWDATTHNLTGVSLPSGQTIGVSRYTGNFVGTNFVRDPNFGFIQSISSQPGPTIGIASYTSSLPATIHLSGTGIPDLWATNTFDNLNRAVSTAFTDGSAISNVYTRLDLAAQKDRLGYWTYYGYDGLEHLTSITDALSNVTHFSWCDCGALASVTDALTNTAYLFYNNQELLTNVVFADGSSLTNYYDSSQRLTKVADGLNRSLTAGYNNEGMVTLISNAYGAVFQAVYDAVGRPLQITDANNLTATNTFDLLDRLLTRSWSGGGIEGFLWSTNGLVAYTNQDERATLFTRDAASHITGITNANLEVTAAAYNAFGEVTDLWDGRTNHTTWHFNQYGWPTNKVDALGHEVLRLTYNPNGQVTNRWAPQSTNTVYAYDPVGNLTNITYVGSTTPSVTYAYDALYRVKTMVDALGTHTFTHTPAGQLQSEIGSFVNDGVANIYSQQLRQALNLALPGGGTWGQTYGYDSAWRLQTLASPAGSFTYGYNVGANLSPAPLVRTVSLPNAAWVTNHFDSLDRLDYTALVNAWGHVLDGYAYTHDPLGLRTNVSRYLGLSTNLATVGYDNIGQIISWVVKESSDAVRQNEQHGFGYDKAGNLLSRTNGSLIQTFACDALNELTNITRNNFVTFSGSLSAPTTNITVNGLPADQYGDLTFARTNLSLVDGPNTFTMVARNAFGTNSTNIVAVNLPAQVALRFDANGSLTNDGTRVFIYDAENRLVTNYVSGAWKSEFVYDGLGRRRIERDYGWSGSTWGGATNELHFIYDGWLLVQARDGNNNVLVTYTRGLDLSGSIADAGGIGGLLARTDGNGSTFYHADGSGNVTALIDNYQLIRAGYEYNPFGRLVAMHGPLGPANEMQFSSMPVHRLSGMPHFLGREYGPDWHGFLTADPVGEAGGIPLHGFVGNNPLSYVDPYGLSWYGDLLSYVGDKELAVADAVKQFFLGPPGGAQLKDPNVLRAGSGLIRGLKDEHGNDITKDTVAEVAMQPLLAVLGGPEREGATLFGDAVKCKRVAKLGKAAETAARGKTVLGHYPAYRDLAEQLGARRFNIPTEYWNKMSSAEQWAANQKFLDRMIARGDDIILATPLDKVKPGSFFERELQYLQSKGFKPSADGTRMIPGGGN